LKPYSQKTQDFFPRPVVWLGWILIAGSVTIAFFNGIIGSLFGILSLLVVTGREGLMIDGKRKKLKYYWGIFGLKFGGWEELPQFSRISISGKIFVKKGKKIASGKEFEVKLWFKEFNDYVLACSGNYTKCNEKAAELAKLLKIKVVNVIKPNGKAIK